MYSNKEFRDSEEFVLRCPQVFLPRTKETNSSLVCSNELEVGLFPGLEFPLLGWGLVQGSTDRAERWVVSVVLALVAAPD